MMTCPIPGIAKDHKMPESVSSLEELIRHRFLSVEHRPPRDVLASSRDRKFEERLLTEGLLIGKKWDELSDKDIEGVAKNEGLAHLSCESFVYYLPAFLLWTLRDSCWRGNLVDSLVSEMTAAAKGLPLYGIRLNAPLIDWVGNNKDIVILWSKSVYHHLDEYDDLAWLQQI